MNRKTLMITLAVATAISAAAGLAWWIGMNQGMAMMAAPAAAAAAPVDPSQWSIPQGEAATRRHIRDGLKAGDIDPATGRRIQNYHDPMVPGKQFDAPAKSPFMDMMLVRATRVEARAAVKTAPASASARVCSRTWACAPRRWSKARWRPRSTPLATWHGTNACRT
jgi:Cu(I)/Ag(I) efflux system membrane fusion protein